MLNICINGVKYTAPEGATILQIAEENGISIPTLCYLKDICADSLCRMCVVEVKGSPKLLPACSTKATEGMIVETESETVVESRKTTLDFICRNHRMECETCSRYTDCELHALLRRYGMDDRIYMRQFHKKEKDRTSPAIVRDYSKCILCRRCEAICDKLGFHALGALHRAKDTRIGAVVPMPETGCVSCGQCLAVCPTGALSIANENKLVRIALNRKKHVVAALTKFSASEMPYYFGKANDPAGKLVHLLHDCGLDKVFDAAGFYNLAAIETAEDLAKGHSGMSPVCPAAVNAAKETALARHPEAVFHEWCKTTYAEKNHLAPEDIFTLWISPCTALKAAHECDGIMTTRELYDFLLRACVSRYTMRDVWKTAPTESFDASVPSIDPCNDLGGIMEAVSLCARELGAESIEFTEGLVCPGGCTGNFGGL